MSDEENVVEMLRAISVFADADADILGELESLARVVTVPKGAVVFSEGDKHTDVYFVSSGTIALDMVTTECGNQRVLTVGDGDLLAWSAMLSDCRMTASAVATEPSRMLAFPADKLRELCDANHDVGYVVMAGIAKLVSRRLLATRLQLLDLFHD